MKTPHMKLIDRSPLRLSFLLILLALACFALAPQARAECRKGCDERFNTFLGTDALLNNTTGDSNVAIGYHALYRDTSGNSNTAIGNVALARNIDGTGNVAIGGNALEFNTTGDINTATGFFALENNTTGSENTATGDGALFYNTTGNDNTATGVGALGLNQTGSENTAMGVDALAAVNPGNENTACGFDALASTTGSNNIGLGHGAGSSLTTGDHNIDIGNEGVGGESGVIRIGAEGTHTATYIAGIAGVPVGGAHAIGVTAEGQLGVRPSSARYKEAIQPMNKSSEALLNLKPVTFRYKKQLDRKGVRQFGLVAEDVEKVNPDLVARDEQGKPYTVRYEAVNAMLLNEFLKEHHKVEQLEKQVEALTAGLQRLSAQLELSKPAPLAVVSNE